MLGLGPRETLKNLREFARRELEEKKAKRVEIRRVKLTSTLVRGWLPDLVVREVRGVHYLICVFRGEGVRVYYAGKSGEVLGAEDLEGERLDQAWRKIERGTKRVLQLPSPRA